MVLPRELSSLSDATVCATDANNNDDTVTVVDGDDLRLTAQGRLSTADDFGGSGAEDNDGGGGEVEDGDGIADELIKAREGVWLSSRFSCHVVW